MFERRRVNSPRNVFKQFSIVSAARARARARGRHLSRPMEITSINHAILSRGDRARSEFDTGMMYREGFIE